MVKTQVKVRVADIHENSLTLIEELQSLHAEAVRELLRIGDYTPQQISKLILLMQKKIDNCRKETHRQTA